jgi:citrate lyase subunit beta/citryl-CoA lyase
MVNDGLPLRSLLFVPGTRRDRFDKAASSGADAIVIDLEDAVDPSRKVDAREICGEWLAQPARTPTRRFVRVNAPNSPWLDDDLQWLTATTGADGVLVPKVESAADLERVARAAGPRPIVPLLESARAILRADAILSNAPPLAAICLGAEDLTAEIGVPRTTGGEEIFVARGLVVLAATAAGVPAIDAVFTDVASIERLDADARRARALGFHGKLAVHPAQVPVLNSVFTPTADEIARAQAIVHADADARGRGDAVSRLGNQMIDEPVVRRARHILALARQSAR